MGVPGSGRRPKTRQELQQKDTFRSDRHADLKNPTPTAGQPEMPRVFDEDEQAEWHRMIWAFEDMGMLHRVDVFAVQQYCRLFVETERVRQQQAEAEASLDVLEANIADVKKDELVQLFSQIVTLRKLVSKCTDQLRTGRMAIRQYLIEFGLTPASRGRIKLPAARENLDEFAAYQRRGAA